LRERVEQGPSFDAAIDYLSFGLHVPTHLSINRVSWGQCQAVESRRNDRQ
jgi:hypothetical protein